MSAGDVQSALNPVLQVAKAWASDPDRSAAVVHDETMMGALVLILDNADDGIVNSALQTLYKLAEWPQHRVYMKNFLGLMDQLHSLAQQACPAVQDLAGRVTELLCYTDSQPERQEVTRDPETGIHHGPLRETFNQNRPAEHCRSLKPKRKTTLKNKLLTLQIKGMQYVDDVDTCRNRLLTVKGVVSITFDYKKKRAIIRTKPDLKPELLAKAISETMTMSAEQVVKDENGHEILLSFGSNAQSVNKENEVLPEYPPEDSPVKDGQPARFGCGPPPKNWFLKNVTKFLSESFYW